MSTPTLDAPPLEIARVLLSLARLRGVRNRDALELLGSAAGRLGDVDGYELFMSLASGRPGFPDGCRAAWDESARRLEACLKAGIEVVPYFGEDYPGRLRGIDDPPVVLFVKGRVAALHRARSVAIVGTRSPTDFGRRTARDAGRLAAESGVAVVSGLALGCDAEAHEGCVEGDGAGVAVLAHGLDRVYPAANRDLADRLLGRGGCLVSELPAGVRPARWAFAYRNRIQSGLSDRVLVIESDVGGGTMHTADFARRQRRPLACMEHPVGVSPAGRSRGNRVLIDEGAAIGISGEAGLRSFLAGRSPRSAARSDARPAGEQLGMGI